MSDTKTVLTLRRLRKQILGKTQIDFAADLGVSVRTYIRYEQTGAPQPILKLAARMMQDKLKEKPNATSNKTASPR